MNWGLRFHSLGRTETTSARKICSRYWPRAFLRSGAAGLVRRVLEESQLPVVLDAGGVDALRDHVDLLSRRQAPLILTPHLGEFSRLTGTPTSEIATRGIALARDFAREYGVWLVLKGFRTLLADPQGRVRVCPLGNPGMATAGMGDVLTGVIGGLFAGHAAQGTSQGALAAASQGSIYTPWPGTWRLPK